ncbi:AAA family ATPase [Sedimentibacter sp. zth1]|uniref:AAA family ATPase n=1 Tax=Sedimentibacter sp. zth1 TaxID=2816908 RepID=UPI001A91C09C|nr:AAA family ATPase [Sedimentibacter sp. zth1]QSX04685.1 AAA family ATPase [Sedimentibacter sp. zth1]
MIKKIKLSKTACYSNETEINPVKINYIYGSNGSGKTTISKVIADESYYTGCNIDWSPNKVEALVYNRDFVSQNFTQSSEIKGIFTLGKNTKDAKELIENKTLELKNVNKEVESYKKSIKKLEEEIQECENEMIKKCWGIKKKYEDVFKNSFTGFIGRKVDFFHKCFDKIDDSVELLTFENLYKMSDNLFNKELELKKLEEELDFRKLIELENDKKLKQVIVGKQDIEIGDLINKLNNSDWVRKGITYLKNSESKCPFCQHSVDTNELNSFFEQYFDETYELQCKQLVTFKETYQTCVNQIIEYIKKFILINDNKEIKSILKIIEEKYKNNINKIDEKISNPSVLIELESLGEGCKEFNLIVKQINEKIVKNNELFNNLNNEKLKLTSQVWKFINNELKSDIESYNKKISGKKTGILSIKSKQKQLDEKSKEISSEIKSKESEITSVTHTVNEINNILLLNGFTSFKLRESSEIGYYQIVREDGSNAKETLSEGEYRFITFLYYYQLIKGSTESSGQTREKVVVIDDPICSLDSNVFMA